MVIGNSIGVPFYKVAGGFSPEYQLVYDAMTNKPTGADVVNQAAMLDALVAGGYYAKAEFLDMFSVHTNTGGEAQINWHNPGTFDPTLVNNPTFTAYQGFTGASAGTKYVRSNFIPSVDGTIIGQDNICAIVGVGNNIVDGARSDFGASGSSMLQFNSNMGSSQGEFFCNSGWAGGMSHPNGGSGRKYFALVRNDSSIFYSYVNLNKKVHTLASTSLVNKELHICGRNSNGTAIPSNRQILFAFLFSYLTEAEVTGTIGIMNTYLANYGTNLY